MKTAPQIKGSIITAISYLYIFLFVYAAVSKLIDHHDFSIKLGQSPLLSAFAGTVAVVVPAMELIIVVLLLHFKWRILGLFASFCLMIAFSTYIIIILNFSSYVPCSCGGILENMGWTAHLIFNLIFVFLAFLALIFSKNGKTNSCFSSFSMLLSGVVVSALSVVFLFIGSERIIHSHNNFVRRFPSPAQPEIKKIDLGINSYYFAGIDSKVIYLGNFTAPAYVTLLDHDLTGKSKSRLLPDQPNLPFQDIKVSVVPPHFYITDGTIPAIFKGKISDWAAVREKGKVPYFTLFEAIDSTQVALRLTSVRKRKNTVAIYDFSNNTIKHQHTTMLKRQVDGIFDTDGMLLYNSYQKQLHYVFYYRNQFLTSDLKLGLITEGKTIDTVQNANIKVSRSTDGVEEMAAPPLLINNAASVYKNLLFIKSERIGMYEDALMYKQASIIDVYDLKRRIYVGSQYVYAIDNQKMRNFKVIDKTIFVLSGSFLSVVPLSAKIATAYSSE